MDDHFHKVLNVHKMVERRKELRRRFTSSEEMVWQQIRNNKLGFKFKRQYSIVNYVIDFYCAKAKIAIEIDGEIHNKSSNLEYDSHRTHYLTSLGVKEIRFKNEEVIANLDLVLNKIKDSLPSPKIRRGNEKGEVN